MCNRGGGAYFTLVLIFITPLPPFHRLLSNHGRTINSWDMTIIQQEYFCTDDVKIGKNVRIILRRKGGGILSGTDKNSGGIHFLS